MEEGQLLLDNHHPVAGFRRLLSKHETVIFSAGLMMLLALERLAFKVMVDRMAPFRFVLVQAVALCFALAIGLVLLYRFAFLGARWTLGSFPVRHLVIVAFLDMLHLVPVIIAAADVAPTLTVLLIQCSAPFCIATGTLFCMKRYSSKAVSGAFIISIGACIAMYLPVSHLVKALMSNDPVHHQQHNAEHLRGNQDDYAIIEGYNTLLYLAACIPGAISTMYKQYAMEEHGGNIDALQMSLGVAVFQLVFITLATPVSYRIQHWGRHLDEHAGAIEGLRGGWRCLVTMSDVEDPDGYPVDAKCSAGLPVVLLYVVSTLVVSPMAQKIVDVNNSHTVYHRVMTLSVPTAFFVLCLYNPHIWLLDSLNVYTVAGLAIILYGLSLYHTVTEAENNRDSFQPPAAPATSTTSAMPDGKRYG